MMGLYSIRMRSAEGGPHEEGGRHISGAERIVEESDLESVAVSLIHRALHHSKGKSDFINIRIDAVHDKDIAYVDCIAIDEHQTESVKESHELAKELLQSVVVPTIPYASAPAPAPAGTSDRFFLHRQPAAVPREYLPGYPGGSL